MGCCLINLYEIIKNAQNTPPFMAWMNAVRRKGDAIPFLAFQEALPFKAGSFAIQTQDNRSAGHIYEMFRQSSRHSCPISTLASRQECLHLHTRGKTSGFGRPAMGSELHISQIQFVVNAVDFSCQLFIFF